MPRPVLFVQGGGKGAHQEDAALAASLADALGAGYRVVYPAMPEAADATAGGRVNGREHPVGRPPRR